MTTGDLVLLVDDWIETGSQARAAKQLMEICAAQLVGVVTVVNTVAPEANTDLGKMHALVSADQLPE